MSQIKSEDGPLNEKQIGTVPFGSVREDLVRTAVQFLQNPKVKDSSTTHKEAFLKKKGLSEEEIKLSFHRAGPIPDIQRYFGPLLWGNRDRLLAMEKSLVNLETSVVSNCQDLQETLQQVKGTLAQQQIELSKLSETRAELIAATNNITKLEADIASVKGLLLSRRQFPTVPSASPGIPAWQLSRENEEGPAAKDSSPESGGDPSPVSNGTSSPELLERVDERGGSSE
ncbi:hypothetical protein B566_EDAN015969 [Ephemera danica]|nr:hypothetical protein B566_EDAN015969 [Ephemera danica]